MILPNVHPDVFAALADATDPGLPKDLGVVETMAAPVALEAADAAVKAAQVKLLEIRIGRGMGAKSFFSLTGEISNVKTAVAAARAIVGERGFLVDAVVISRPHRALLEAML
jgi:microcompartment protein CcmL/EutN